MSFLGGSCAFLLLNASRSAEAQEKEKKNTYRAHEFQLLDADDRVVGRLFVDRDGHGQPTLFLGQAESASFSPVSLSMVSPTGSVAIENSSNGCRMQISNGETIWKAP